MATQLPNVEPIQCGELGGRDLVILDIIWAPQPPDLLHRDRLHWSLSIVNEAFESFLRAALPTS